VEEGFEFVSVLMALTVAVLMVQGFLLQVVVGSLVTCTLMLITAPFKSDSDKGESVPTLQLTVLPLAEH
jgi:hypothetical protein